MTRNGRRRYKYHDYDAPYNPLPRPQGDRSLPTPARQEARGWWVGGEWIEQPRPQWSSIREANSRMSPITVNDDADSDCFEVPPPVPQRAGAYQGKRVDFTSGTSHAHFDFNDSNHALPWSKPTEAVSCHKVRSFADCADDDLLEYMADRSIARGFLVEIDQFFRGHPEIADYPQGRDTILQLNTLSPLEGYKYFLRGYTRPARYIDGIVKSEYFTLPADYPYRPLHTKVDPELVDFFDGFEYRHDIVDRIDKAVRGGIRELSLGRPLPSGYRRLICYALWGNPSDAYKWYEYSLQEEYLPHRYLPEHVVLGHIPKLVGDANPQPSILGTSRRHMPVRYRMARANDEGIDVLEVLLTEFRGTLVRKGFRRVDITDMYERAKDRLNIERQNPTGVDIVDLVMDEIAGQRPTARPYIKRNQNASRSNRSHHNTAPLRPIRKGKRTHKATQGNVLAALRAQAAELRSAKANLERCYNQEQTICSFSARCTGLTIDAPQITTARERAERRYVNCIIRYMRDANQMSGVEAKEMQGNFTRRKMGGTSTANRTYLFGMYPRELM